MMSTGDASPRCRVMTVAANLRCRNSECVPTPAREPAVVFDQEGHRFECVLEFHVYEDALDRSLCEEARWRKVVKDNNIRTD